MISETENSPVQESAPVQEVRWLDDDQQVAWRNMVESWRMLIAVLDKDLRESFDIGIPEYEVLVRLSEADDWAWRMSELADDLGMSRSRLTHIVARMEKRGLVNRKSIAGDGRGVCCEMTQQGFSLLRDAAPTHVRGVREHFVDMLSPLEHKHLSDFYGKVHTHLRTLG